MVTKKQMQGIVKCYKSTVEVRNRHEEEMSDITRLMFPQANFWSDADGSQQGRKDRKDIFSSEAPIALDQFSKGFQSWGFGESSDWIGLRQEFGKSRNDSSDSARNSTTDAERKWFQYISRRMGALLSQSNFYSESCLLLKCGGSLGTGAMRLGWNEDKGEPEYECIHPKDFSGMDDRRHIWDTLFRAEWLTKMQALELVGNEPSLLPKAIRQSDDYFKKFKFVTLTCPQKRFDLDEEGGDFISITWFDGEPDKVIKQTTMDRQDFVVWRPCRSLGGDEWGEGSSGQLVLADVKSLNMMERSTQQSAQLAGAPPVKKTRGLKVNITPYGQTELDDNQDFQLVQGAGGDVSWTETTKQRIIGTIHSAFHLDFLMAVSQRKDKEMTRAEVYQLSDEQGRMLSPFVGNLKTEVLEPIIEHLFICMAERGMLEDGTPDSVIPESLKVYDEEGNFRLANIMVDYVSPLTRIQRRAQEVTPTKELIAYAIEMANVNAEVLDKFDFDRFFEIMADVENADVRVLRKQEEVDQIRAQRAEQQAQLANAEAQNNETKAQANMLKAMGKAPEQGSPLQAQIQNSMEG